MSSLELLRNSLISKLLTIEDEKFLEKLLLTIKESSTGAEFVRLSSEQKESIERGLDDLENNRLIDQETLFAEEMRWLNGQ